MRSVIALLLAVVICVTPVLAGGQSNSMTVHMQTGMEETLKPQNADYVYKGSGSVANQSGNANANEPFMAQKTVKTNLSSESSFGENMRMVIRQEQQALDHELSGAPKAHQEVLQNQNRVRLAIQAILAAGAGEEGANGQISIIAEELNNSVYTTIMAEERVRERNQIVSFFTGGDHESAEEILRQVEENRIRVEELKQLIQQYDFSDDVAAVLQEQIINIEVEQNRLRVISEEKIQNNGIFGFFFQ